MSELITTVCTLGKPSLTVLAGEGGSGGAEVFFGTDMRVALAQSYFATIHPIGHSAIGKGRHSPKEISWLLGVDAFHLASRGVVDTVSSLSVSKDVSDLKRMELDFAKLVESAFSHIEEQTRI